MKTKAYAEETPNYNIESKNGFSIDYVTELKSDASLHALERVAEATLQSGLRFMKSVLDEEKGKEQIFLDAEDCTASVVQSLTNDLIKSEYGFEFRSTRQSMDHLVIVFEDEKLVVEDEEESDETEQE